MILAMLGMATTDLKTPAEVTSFFDDPLGASFDCVAEVIDDIDLRPILNLVVAPLVWLFSGLATVAHGLIAVGDIVLDLNGYRIIVTPPAAAATAMTVIDPFTRSGRLQRGWRLDRPYYDPSSPIDCYGDSTGQASPNAVGPGTHVCGATADGASACWLSPRAEPELWCLDPFDANDRALTVRAVTSYEYRTPTPTDPSPLFLELSDGSMFWYRIGGAWDGRADGLVPVYGCANKVSVCGAPGENVILSGQGVEMIDELHPAWRVHVGLIGDVTQSFPPPEDPVGRAGLVHGRARFRHGLGAFAARRAAISGHCQAGTRQQRLVRHNNSVPSLTSRTPAGRRIWRLAAVWRSAVAMA